MAQADNNHRTHAQIVKLRPRATTRRRILVWVDAELWERLLDAGRALGARDGPGRD